MLPCLSGERSEVGWRCRVELGLGGGDGGLGFNSFWGRHDGEQSGGAEVEALADGGFGGKDWREAKWGGRIWSGGLALLVST